MPLPVMAVPTAAQAALPSPPKVMQAGLQSMRQFLLDELP
jgi:hypothetical protein